MRHPFHLECLRGLDPAQGFFQLFHFQVFNDAQIWGRGARALGTSGHNCKPSTPDERRVDIHLSSAFPLPGEEEENYKKNDKKEDETANGNSHDNHWVPVPALGGRRDWNLVRICLGGTIFSCMTIKGSVTIQIKIPFPSSLLHVA